MFLGDYVMENLHCITVGMFSFSHIGMLWLAPLVAVPVVLHLLSRLAPRKLRFPGIRFLRSAPMPLRGRRRWQDLLLMALRCLIIGCGVLLAAGIRWDERKSDVSSTEKGICAILDTSASMEPVVETMGYLAFGLPRETHYIGGARDSWEVGRGVLDTRAVLQEASEWLAHFPPTGRELHIFTDLQANDWADGFAVMPEGTSVEIHTPTENVKRNCGFSGVTVDALAKGRIRILVRFRNWGDDAVERQVTLTLDGHDHYFKITAQPNSAGVLPIVLEQPTDPKGLVKMSPGDDYSFDDQWVFWARGEAAHPVLAVLPSEDEELAEELEAFFVPALTAEPDEAPARYDVAILDCLGVEYADFSELSAIFLLGSAERLSPEVLARVREYVEAGGVLFVVPGNSSVAGWRALQGSGLAPAHGTPLLEKRVTGIGVLPAKSPLASIFPEKASSDLHLLNIRQWLRVETGAEDAVILQTIEDAPALIRRSVGKGTEFLFTFGFHHTASDFVTSKSFLPVLRELADQALNGHSETIRLSCGDPLPSRKDIAGQVIAVDENANTATPGLWTYGNRLVEVNPPTGESIPQFVEEEEVLRALRDNAILEEHSNGDVVMENQVARFLALALCGMLLLEGLFILRKHRVR